VYNWKGRYAGSPYHQYLGSPVSTVGGMHWLMPEDDQVFGTATFNKEHVPGNGPLDDDTIQREQASFWIARQLGVPVLNRRYYFYYVNGNRHGPLMEDTQVPGAEMLKEYWPNDNNGVLYKNNAWFEGEVAPESNGYMDVNNFSFCTLGRYTTTINGVPNQYKLARYRWTWWIRQFTDSANDFSQLYALIDAANTPQNTPAYYANMESQVDTEEWLRLSAAEHATGDLDSLFTLVHWNMYCYKPTLGKWTALKWDCNITLGAGGGWWGADPSNLFTFSTTNPSEYGGYDPLMTAFHSYPPYRRAYLRAFQDLANLAVNNARINPMLDAKYATFVANGLDVADPAAPGGLENWIGTMHNSLLSVLDSQGVSRVAFAVNSTMVSNDVAWVSGTAPLPVKTVWVNGVAWPLTWSTVTNWTLGVPLRPGTNVLSVVGVDLHGQPVAGATNSLTAVYTEGSMSPVGQVVINEIMYNSPVPDAEYVELYNNSTGTTFDFDLSGWQLSGLGYTFPSGSLIGPNRYLVLVANPSAFAGAYGGDVAIFDTFPGSLEAEGQTLKLLEPATNGMAGAVVAAVQYRGSPPWPASANGRGGSLQLIDSHQDNWRAGNWAASALSTAGPSGAQWVYVTVTGTAGSSRLDFALQGSGLAYIDDLKLVAGTVPESGVNLVADGDFESPLDACWTLGPDFTGSGLASNIVHSGNSSLQIVSLGPGTGTSDAIYQDLSPALSTGAVYTLSFWYWQTTNANAPILTVGLSGSGLSSGPLNTGLSAGEVFTPATPGTENGDTAVLSPFPPLWINELQADNQSGITNRLGGRSGWVELYNSSSNTVNLDGLCLSTNYANLTAWSFLVVTTIGPGEFKVLFADGQPALSSSNELHVGLVLNSGFGSLALSRVWQGQAQVLDYLDYTNLAPDLSYGSLPDGQSFDRQEFWNPTPGAPNSISSGPSFIPYRTVGKVYTQDFDALPDPGITSVNAANPVTIGGRTYALANPFDFAAATVAVGNTGGLGLGALAGWYGSAALAPKFGASDGDQTTGGIVSFGLPGSANRALGLLATSSTGATAFGVRFINQTGRTLNYISLQFTGELWRQSDLPKTLSVEYRVDPTGGLPFPTAFTGSLPALNVAFPTSGAAVGDRAVDGTAAINQSNLGCADQVIVDWPPGAALWLVWEMADSTGKAQGLAIDNLSFSASDQPSHPPGLSLGVQLSDGDLLVSWSSSLGTTYQMQSTTDLNSGLWLPLGAPLPGTGGVLTSTNAVSGEGQRFFRLSIVR
jgi:CotH kinase protein/Lamin Tail Domain